MRVGVHRAGRAYRSDTRQEQARRTRRRIVDAAHRSFEERGYTGTTMRLIAADAGVSVPTVESLFGTKAAVLKEAIDVSIAGDDEPVSILDRDWTVSARSARTPEELLAVAARVLGLAQQRSAGLVLAVFEGSAADPELDRMASQLIEQRLRTAGWLVHTIKSLATLRPELGHQDAVDAVWLLMDSAVYVRLTRHRGWCRERYETWFARTVRNLLLPDPLPTHSQPTHPATDLTPEGATQPNETR